MKTDNAKPAVITAAEFVAGGYAERIAAGECVVFDNANCIVLRVDPEEDGYDDHVLISYTDGLMVYSWAYERDAKFTVHWLPVAASSTDADEVARLRADVARLWEALANARFTIHFVMTFEGMSGSNNLRKLYDELTAALETGEAQS